LPSIGKHLLKHRGTEEAEDRAQREEEASAILAIMAILAIKPFVATINMEPLFY
jgi:hypothetical protein